jgi:hypothetical protein
MPTSYAITHTCRHALWAYHTCIARMHTQVHQYLTQCTHVHHTPQTHKTYMTRIHIPHMNIPCDHIPYTSVTGTHAHVTPITMYTCTPHATCMHARHTLARVTREHCAVHTHSTQVHHAHHEHTPHTTCTYTARTAWTRTTCGYYMAHTPAHQVCIAYMHIPHPPKHTSHSTQTHCTCTHTMHVHTAHACHTHALTDLQLQFSWGSPLVLASSNGKEWVFLLSDSLTRFKRQKMGTSCSHGKNFRALGKILKIRRSTLSQSHKPLAWLCF